MLLLLDESGDDGVAHHYEANVWFCYTAVVMQVCDVSALESCFADLREKHGGKEFHFAKDNNTRRAAALVEIAKFPFSYYAVGCNKRLLRQHGWKHSHDLLREVATRLLALVPIQSQESVSILFDTLGGAKTDNKHKTFLRQHVRGVIGHKPKLEIEAMGKNGATCPHGSLVDYVCGVFARTLREHNNTTEQKYFDLIKSKEAGRLCWPEEKKKAAP